MTADQERELGCTHSLCPECLVRIPARYIQRQGKVYMDKTCPAHGPFSTLVWEEGADFSTWDDGVVHSRPHAPANQPQKGCPYDCGLCTSHAQAACCVLVEITQRCNQQCPVCFAQAQQESPATDYTLDEMSHLLDFLQQQSGEGSFNIQLSGGEPTLHPQLAEIIRLCREKGFSYVQVNTNGQKLAQSVAYAKTLRKAGLHTVFLQFDGTREDIYQTLRGQPLLGVKEQAVQNSVAAGLGVVLVMTVVPGVNDDNVGDTIRYAAQRLPRVRGVHFQPISYFGRFPAAPGNEDRITIPGLISRIVGQTSGQAQWGDFVPLASGHGRCSFHGNFLVTAEGWQGLSQKQPTADHSIEKARDYLARRWSAPPQEQAGCCPAPPAQREPITPAPPGGVYNPGEWQAIAAKLKRQTLAITAMAFQDAWTVDLDRLRRCRLHVATRDKKLVPFCAFNITSRNGQRLHQQTGRQ